MNSRMKKINKTDWVVRLSLILLSVAFLMPLYFSLTTSFKSMQEFYESVWSLPHALRFENYSEAFSVGHVGEYLFNSIVITVMTICLVQICSITCAYALARLKIKGAEIIVLFLYAFQILPQESNIIPLFMICSKLGITDVTYLPQIVAYVGWCLPGTIIIMKNFFMSIPVELLEAARIDGSTELNTMVKIVLPLRKSPILTCVVMNFSFAWGELMWEQLSTIASSKGIQITVGLLNFQGMYGTNWPLLCAAIVMVLIPLFVLFAFAQKYFVAGLTSGGVKG